MNTNKEPYLIAEIGVNFYDTAHAENITPIEAAKKYIFEAKKSGVSAVKFQSYKANTIASKNSPAYWDLSKEATKTQFDLFKKYDSFSENDYYDLSDYSKQLNIDFLSTPFDYKSVDYLDQMCDAYKISSSDLNNLPFINYIAKKGKPIYLSTGASYISEIDEAVRTIRKVSDAYICLMHCVLSYPCEYEDANLSAIKVLKNIFQDLDVGYSDHTPPDSNMTVLAMAYLYGANVIEKHFTLDKRLIGNDHYHSGNQKDFINSRSNFELIKKLVGNSKKTVLNCEINSRREARRSLVLARDMKKDETVKIKDIIAKRPGTGISPQYIDVVVGRKLKNDLMEDTLIYWDDLN